MTEKLALASVGAATGMASYGWLSTANDIGTLLVTIIAGVGGIAALLYHIERWKKLRRENKRGEKE